jgi:hypothetical protein
MTLFQATLLTGLFLIAFGAHFLWHGMRSAKSVQAFPRSRLAAYLLMGTASAWFLYHVTQLGPADFGQYKHLLFALFLTIAVGAFFVVPDFLAVRGLAALILLVAGVLLEAGFMQAPKSIPLNLFVYFAILLALVLGANPYKLRDFLEWLYKADARPRIFGGIAAAYGLFLTGVTFTY